MSLPPRAPPIAAYWPSGHAADRPTLAQISALQWAFHASNPLIRPTVASPSVADPSFLPPSETPDGRWHLLARGLLGLHHYSSADGLTWTAIPGVVARLASRPHLIVERGRSFLATERGSAPLGPRNSTIELRSSADLFTWSAPRTLLRAALGWHRDGASDGVGSPCTARLHERFCLYYSAGGHIGLATSDKVDGPYLPDPDPILSPTGGFKDAGALTVLPVKDGLLGVQRSRRAGDQGIETAEIHLLGSTDGRNFSPLVGAPTPALAWPLPSSEAPALDLRWVEGHAMLYFNVANPGRWRSGGTAIGLAVGSPTPA